ncbi:hypothetical protein B0H17DRAFT_1218961 [Mycena rosella]|uniref:Uncharacterized protein n=1 Tax=Mycena rosella TaxID=1033263 RepID=A0AAD7FHD2_MYCRO|nr:hypothetical protein B0H17DRAFT_1218961 [Mycena rosella]
MLLASTRPPHEPAVVRLSLRTSTLYALVHAHPSPPASHTAELKDSWRRWRLGLKQGWAGSSRASRSSPPPRRARLLLRVYVRVLARAAAQADVRRMRRRCAPVCALLALTLWLPYPVLILVRTALRVLFGGGGA